MPPGPQVFDPQKKHDIVSGLVATQNVCGKKNHPESWGRFPSILTSLFFSKGVETEAPSSFSFPAWFHGGGSVGPFFLIQHSFSPSQF